MHRTTFKTLFLTGCALSLLTVSACAKKTAVKTAPALQPKHEAPVVARSTPTPAQSPAQVARTTPAPASRYPDSKTLAKIDELLARIQDAYFDYDKHNLRPDAMKTLQSDAQTLAQIIRQYPDFKLTVEGYADERGSEEYNLALGDARAMKTKEYLVELGLPGEQMNVVSYGKEKQVCTEHNEDCWQKNRRTHVKVADARVHQ